MTALFENLTLPANGQEIQWRDGNLEIPAHPFVTFIEGDGIGPDIWSATRLVLDKAVEKFYGSDRSIAWVEIYAGEKARNCVESGCLPRRWMRFATSGAASRGR